MNALPQFTLLLYGTVLQKAKKNESAFLALLWQKGQKTKSNGDTRLVANYRDSTLLH
jgi:hypothetical protein